LRALLVPLLFNSHLIKIVRSRELGRREIYGPDQLEKRETHREFYDPRNQKCNFDIRARAGLRFIKLYFRGAHDRAVQLLENADRRVLRVIFSTIPSQLLIHILIFVINVCRTDGRMIFHNKKEITSLVRQNYLTAKVRNGEYTESSYGARISRGRGRFSSGPVNYGLLVRARGSDFRNQVAVRSGGSDR